MLKTATEDVVEENAEDQIDEIVEEKPIIEKKVFKRIEKVEQPKPDEVKTETSKADPPESRKK